MLRKISPSHWSLPLFRNKPQKIQHHSPDHFSLGSASNLGTRLYYYSTVVCWFVCLLRQVIFPIFLHYLRGGFVVKFIKTGNLSIGYLRGVNVIAETSVLVTNEAQTFNWKGYGLKLHIPPGTLPADLEECRLLMKVGLSGQFELPENTSLVSAVYWIDTEPRCKFSQHLTMEIQHCVKLTLTSKLSFVHARCSQKHLPYAFEAKDGGVFSTESAYGCVQLTHFSIWSVIYKMLVPGVQLYSASVYYLRKGVNRIDIHFAIIKNLEAHATVSSKSSCSLFIAVIC